MAGILILCSDSSNAQAVYTNIEPDIEIQFDGETAVVDIDGNGTIDFEFLKTSATTSFTAGTLTLTHYLRRFWAGPAIETNEIAGIMVTHGAGYGTTYFPYALAFSDEVGNDLSFQNWGFQVLGSGFYDSNGIWHYDLGKWSPDIDSAYLGIHFLGADDCMHYGWMRCSMVDSVDRFIIHDCAYESKCNTTILAGDTIGDTVTVNMDEVIVFNPLVYSFGKTLYVKTDEPWTSADILVYDLSGKLIHDDKIINQFTQIELNQKKGIYLVELIAGENKFTKKIYIN